jgi:3-phosphoshikimate 1-carboxyvinyltransferase
MKLQYNKSKAIKKARIELPYSKSLYNRMLILKALNNDYGACNYVFAKDPDDVNILKKNLLLILKAQPNEVTTLDCGPAGTAFRFLTAICSLKNGEFILTGSERMQQRPIEDLVDALKQLNADITYEKAIGFPPLKIKGKALSGKHIKINVEKSSQYISALLMIAPFLETDLEIEMYGESVSEPYTKMTMALVKQLGVNISRSDQTLYISKRTATLNFEHLSIEADWSAASYWYSLVALQENLEVKLVGLNKVSLQGDSVLQNIMVDFGVYTTFEKDVCILRKGRIEKRALTIDCNHFPDLAQTLIVIGAASGMNLTLTGLSTLVHKETNRLVAIKTELEKAGAELEIRNNDSLIIKKHINISQLNGCTFDTYEDHRMAMCLAPLALLTSEGININHPEVVKKSYPLFWDDLTKVGVEGESNLR